MTIVLLLVIYAAYIGLGVPDSLIGTAWPAIYPEFGVPVSAVSYVSVLISCGTVISSFFSARLIRWLGTGRITAASTVLTAAALFGFSVSNSLLWLCLLALPLGLGAGAVDTSLNNYVALHYPARVMNFLHCAYGVGVSLSPFIMSLALGADGNWRGGYRAAFVIQLIIAGITILALPLWGKQPHAANAQIEEGGRRVSFLQLLKMPAVRANYGVFIGSCSIEAICLAWGSTFLVTAKGAPADFAARIMTLYFAGIALGRFLSGLLTSRMSCWRLVFLGQAVTAVSIVLLLLPLSAPVAGIALFLTGLGNGAVFPNMTHLTPENFGRDLSASVIGTQMAVAYIGFLLMPPLFGLLAEWCGVQVFSIFLLALFLMMAGATWLLKRHLCTFAMH